MKPLALFSAGIALLSGCVAALPHASEADVQAAQSRFPGTSVTDLEQGRRDYVTRCTGCHHLHVPSKFPAHAWQQAVDEMRDKHGVKITDQEAQSVLRYLITLSGDERQVQASRRASRP